MDFYQITILINKVPRRAANKIIADVSNNIKDSV